MAEAASGHLIEAITKALPRASTQALDISFNELLDMYRNKELNIAPDFQRLFRWSPAQRSRFMESLLLEMPVPPIFMIEEEEGRYVLIDGLQRISSYLHFRGELDADHLDPPVKLGEKLELVDCDIVKELNGLTFDRLDVGLQIRLKRAFIRVEVVRKGSDPHFKYHMFKRLNTGGELLSEQQVRNSTIRMLSSAFPEFLIAMSKVEDFDDCTEYLTRERLNSGFDQELILRFFALKNRRHQFKHEVSDFLTEYMEDIADSSKPETFAYESEEAIFRKTFAILKKSLGAYSFAFAKKDRSGLSGGFSTYHYEAITVGIQEVLPKIDPNDDAVTNRVRSCLEKVKLDPEFIKITTGGGKNSPGPLNNRINFVAGRLKDEFA
jgi:Protein of unknown function DUF262